ncbi:MAG: hypothetical protein AAGG44_09910 [Planctomycetota bacterium]
MAKSTNTKAASQTANESEQPVVAPGDQEIVVDRRRDDRRDDNSCEVDDLAGETPENAPQPRRKKQRRRQIDPTTCERDYNDEELRFMRAMDDYKRDSGRMFPTCSEILEVVRGLGYIKLTEEEQQLIDSIQQVEDELAEVGEASDETNEESLESLFSEENIA